MYTALRDLTDARRPGEGGATLVEFAVVLFLLLTLMLGVAEFGAICKDWMVLHQAAREGARIAIVGATNDVVATRVRASAPSLNPSRVVVQVRYSDDDGATFGLVPGVETGFTYNNVPARCLMRVNTAYPHRLMSGVVLPGVTEVTLRCTMIMQRQ